MRILLVPLIFAVLCGAATGQKTSTDRSRDLTIHPDPGAKVEYEWGIPVEILPNGHRKPLWKGSPKTAKSARTYSTDAPEAKVQPAPTLKPAATAEQKAIPKDDKGGDTAAPPGDGAKPKSEDHPNGTGSQPPSI